MIDISMTFYDNWDNMDDLALNPEKIPMGEFELIYNSATGKDLSVLSTINLFLLPIIFPVAAILLPIKCLFLKF